jgi:hypothetical protein
MAKGTILLSQVIPSTILDILCFPLVKPNFLVIGFIWRDPTCLPVFTILSDNRLDVFLSVYILLSNLFVDPSNQDIKETKAYA